MYTIIMMQNYETNESIAGKEQHLHLSTKHSCFVFSEEMTSKTTTHLHTGLQLCLFFFFFYLAHRAQCPKKAEEKKQQTKPTPNKNIAQKHLY